MKKVLCALAALSGLAASSYATVAIEYQLGWVPGVADGTVGVLVVDTLGDGFSGIDMDIDGGGLSGKELSDGTMFGSDDLIIDRVVASDLGGVFGFLGSVDGLALGGGIDTGDPVGVYWFNSPSSDPVEPGQTYGFFRTDSIDASSGANSAFVIPADGSGVNMFAFSSSLTGDAVNSAPDAAFLANSGVVIPEPSALLLALGGMGFFGIRRRR